MLLAYAVGMAGGQLLFKAAALRYDADATTVDRVLSLIGNAFFLSAIVLYVALTILWVWVLTFTPLSKAYPFVALAFVLTPLLGGVVFGEPIQIKLLIGIGLVFCGLVLVAA
jgi:drug/metabolite transporter (DMT)-like permease